MGSGLEDGRYAPPQAHVEDVEDPGGATQLATRGTRLAAAIVDTVIAMGLLWVVSKVTPWNPWDPDISFWSFQPVTALGGMALFLLAHGYLLATRGQTIGKLALKIRITRSNGEKASFGRLVGLRYGVGALTGMVPGVAQIYGLIDALLIFRKSRKCLHDNIADTIVVKA
jgi:uncharacterized RDD family membrane protein YckC